MEKDTLKNILNLIKEKENKENNRVNKFIKKIEMLEKIESDRPFTEDELNIKGDLDLSNSKIKSLPKGLEVGGKLNLCGCISLTSLPEGLNVGGNLDLKNSTITTFSKGFC